MMIKKIRNSLDTEVIHAGPFGWSVTQMFGVICSEQNLTTRRSPEICCNFPKFSTKII